MNRPSDLPTRLLTIALPVVAGCSKDESRGSGPNVNSDAEGIGVPVSVPAPE